MTAPRFQLGSTWIGPDEPVYFIADIAANHDGDLARAKRLIELAGEAGANAAKFQNFKAAKIVSRHGFERLGSQLAHQAAWKKSVYEVYEDAAISSDWTPRLREHCDKVGIEYFTSPYDVESIDQVDPYVRAFKIGSGDITFTDVLVHMAKKGKPLLLATGASTLEDVREAIATIRAAAPPDTPLCLMQCNTNYTGSLDNFRHIQLNVLKTFGLLFPDALPGLSDHTPGHATVLGAVALGARVVEKHFTDDNGREGPDHPFSMNPRTWREMVDRTRELELALGTTEKRIEENELKSAIVQRRALHFARAVRAGDLIEDSALEALRPAPAGSVAPNRRAHVIGLRAPKDYERGDVLLWSDWR
jgi:N-acetylneuraminate synthase